MSELSLYQTAVTPTHGITFGSRVQLHKGGWRGVLLDEAHAQAAREIEADLANERGGRSK